MDSSYTLPEDIKAAYINTDYSFTDGTKTIVIRLDESNAELLAFVKQEQIASWAYMTAWNPISFPQTDEYNKGQQELLLEKLKGFKLYKGEGKGRDGVWPGEESYFIADITREEACEIGRDFGQNAILVSDESMEPDLIFLFEE